MDKLLDNIKVLFTNRYRSQVTRANSSIVDADFDAYFDQQVRELERSEDQATHSDQATDLTPPSSSDTDAPPPQPYLLRPTAQHTSSAVTSSNATPIVTPDTSRPSTPSHLLSGTVGSKTSRRGRKAAAMAAASLTPTYQSSGDESKKQRPQKGKPKRGRTWDADGMAGEDDEIVLDYSAATSNEGDGLASGFDAVDTEAVGTRTSKGQFILKDLDDEVHNILKNAQTKENPNNKQPTGMVSSGLNAISGLFRNVVGGKVLTEEDLEKAMKGMEEHLLDKNVAREAAVHLCDSVKLELVGVKTGNFESKCIAFWAHSKLTEIQA